jgi:hypothetical protein
VAAGLGLVGIGYAGLGGQDNTTRNDTGEIVEGGELGAFRIRLGDCFRDTIGSEIESVDAVPCSGPHMYEVYGAFNLPGDEYPGVAAVNERADQGCYDRFGTFVGIEYEFSKYDFGSITPTPESWAELDDREILCLISNYDGTSKTGSARNTRE